MGVYKERLKCLNLSAQREGKLGCGSHPCVSTSEVLAPFSVSCTPTLGREGVIHSVAWPSLSPPIAKASSHHIFLGTQMLPVPLGRNKGASSGRFFAAKRYSRPWLET